MQVELDRLRTSVHELRSRVVVLEINVASNTSILNRLETKVDGLARKDEIEEAIKTANRDTRARFWHTWQGSLAFATGVVVLAAASLGLWDRLF